MPVHYENMNLLQERPRQDFMHPLHGHHPELRQVGLCELCIGVDSQIQKHMRYDNTSDKYMYVPACPNTF